MVIVIAILATITIVSFNNISGRAKSASLSTDLVTAVKKLEVARTETGGSSYPTALASTGFISSANSTLNYQANGSEFCFTGSNGTLVMSATQENTTPRAGGCAGFNYATNGSAETDTSCWSSNNGAGSDRSAIRASHGSYSIRGFVSSAVSDRYVYCLVPIDGAGSWSITADVFLAGTGATDYSRGMWAHINPGTVATSISYNSSLVNQWQTLTRTITSTDSSTSIMVRFYVQDGANIYVDNVRVVRA